VPHFFFLTNGEPKQGRGGGKEAERERERGFSPEVACFPLSFGTFFFLFIPISDECFLLVSSLSLSS
jgi:hypothetical protein